MECLPPKIRNKARLSALTPLIQISTGSSSYYDKAKKKAKILRIDKTVFNGRWHGTSV